MLLRHALAAAALAATLAAAAPAPAAAQRLPGDAVPRHYTIELDPDLAAGTLTGRETIDVDLPGATSAVTLHAVGFEIVASARSGEGLATRHRAAVTFDTPAETATLHFDEALPAGPARLELAFTGKVRDDLRGLYRIRVDGADGHERQRWLAATQFEGTYARMMFPCFDEPQYKATFDLSVVAERGAIAISNGAMLKDEAGPRAGTHRVVFATSPKMSTYLVALAVGDLACVEGASDGVPLRVCALAEKKELGRFALQAAERFLHFYDGWYGIKYPFGKLDMIAFPEYEWGGMENTAAVFYKERALLVDPATASVNTRRRVASVVAHEMAHQWFGDLVTMQWWDNVWLNEGFATWMAHKPLVEWDAAWDQDVEATRSTQEVLAADALASTRPIRQNAATAAEIKELFDGVAYEKGAAMLRMVEAYVGEDVFRSGVNAYLARHANGSATAEDFWSELARVSGQPVERVLASFVDQAGSPLVTVDARCANGNTSVNLSQERFYADPALLTAGSTERWTVPVCVRAVDAATTGPAAVRCELLSERSQSFELAGCAPFVLLNAGARGTYRAAYAGDSLARVAAAAAALTPAEQVALLEDQWALVRAGRVEVGAYLRLAEGLAGSRNLTVVSVLVDRLRSLERLLDAADTAPYRAWLVRLLRPAATELGFAVSPGESDDRRTLRGVVFAAMGAADDAESVAAAERLTVQALADPASVDANLLSPALQIAAAHGDAALYDRFLAAMASAKTPEQAFRWLVALASFRDEALVRRSLDFALSPRFRAQDLPGFTSLLIESKESRPLAWAWIKAHWSELKDKVVSFGGGGAVAALGSFCDAGAAADIEGFFAKNRAPAAERAAKQSVEAIRSCAELKARLQKPLRDWLVALKPAAGG